AVVVLEIHQHGLGLRSEQAVYRQALADQTLLAADLLDTQIPVAKDRQNALDGKDGVVLSAKRKSHARRRSLTIRIRPAAACSVKTARRLPPHNRQVMAGLVPIGIRVA